MRLVKREYRGCRSRGIGGDKGREQMIRGDKGLIEQELRKVEEKEREKRERVHRTKRREGKRKEEYQK